MDRPLKVLMLTSSYPKFPGDVTAPFIEAIAQHTQTLGHKVTVVMPYHPELKRQPLENGVRLFTYHYALHPKWNVWGYAASLQGDVKVRKLIYLLLPFVLVASFLKLWALTGKERFAIIQAHWVIPNAPVAVLVGQLRRIPVVISLHGSDVYMAERIKPVGWVARWAFRRAAAVTASSPDLLQRAQKLGATMEPTRAVVIPYGADPKAFAAPSAPRTEIRQRLGFGPDEAILLCVGRLVYKKGFEYALRAMPLILAEYPKAQLVIAGKGDLEGELKALAAQLNLTDRVRFEGAVPHNRLPEYLAACDLFLLPSVIDDSGNVDGLPNTLLEALAAGRPVVASNVAGVPLAVEDGVNGQLVAQRDPVALAAAIKELLNDSARCEQFSLAARAKIETELNWTAIAGRYVAVFQAAALKSK
ncbi:MAG: glycosyltransferase [Chloroflexota bacterium]